ncbi:methionine/alanine import family NSS transporter small subunit [Streptomyces litchfieldiae]|uniref:Methionine/alanine import family NSS transporter small subunit n=1 Tax=Streptomyces litchfieldiae TaxID=3075543 RepID=A0ABU2MW14_9ACTN|nr:methionine/alanine import family NSS transporter small subunit [Streptomyces sp. DSM 44938]MDT0345284.1 methionine/alanine import family NSS transporter small subunit [Streptomyces sp. DSM 44938]
MSAGAIVMMIVAMVVVWGGLIAAILKLRGHPDELTPN